LFVHIKKLVSYSFGTWVSAIISFFTTPIITYFIIPDEFGKASMFLLVYNIAYLVSLLGLDESYMRYFNNPKVNRNKLFWECLLPSLLVGFLISLIVVLLNDKISLILFGKIYDSFKILFLLSLISGIFQRYNQLSVRMQKKGVLYSLIGIIQKSTYAIVTIIYVIFVDKSFFAVIWGQIFGNISALFFGFFVDKENRTLYSVSFKNIKEYIKYGIPLVPTALLYWMFSSIDRIMLRQFSTFSEIGLYSAAFRINTAFSLFTVGFLAYWKPLAFEKNEKSDEPIFFRKAASITSFIMFVMGLIVLSLKDIIVLIMAESYKSASYIIPFLILNPVMTMISETTVMGIYFKKKTYWHIVITLISAFTNFVGNLILVPILAARGAAISTGLSYVLYFTLRTIIAEKLYPIGFELRKIYTGTAIIIFVAIIGTFRKGFIEVFIGSIFGLFLMLFVYRKEVKYMLNSIKNRNK